MLDDTSRELIRLALAEDLGSGDLTTDCLIPKSQTASCFLLAKEQLVVCGHEVARAVFALIDGEVIYKPLVEDGAVAPAGASLGTIAGPLGSILKGERTALNFLQRLSGVATKTREFVEAVKPSSLQILDTRKTTPGFRTLEKYAVRMGGGRNHRVGLFDAVLIKNNHIDALGGDLRLAVAKCRKGAPPGTKIQVEVRNQIELTAAIDARPDAVLLDNMSPEQIREFASQLRKALTGGVFIEASGGITRETVASFVVPGLDAVSVGALTHSARAMDISLRIKSQ